ncbi:MAG: hypothetical protein KDE27_30190 [Planctomycetes bacterium]|nr:hypothetical protein [Planctomycetota bacterium]
MLRTLTNRPLLTLAALLAFGAAAAAQDPDPKAPDPEIPAKVDQLEDCVKDRKLERDAEGVTVIDTLMQKIQAGVNEKDQKEITDALGDVLNKGKVRPPQDTGLYVAAIKALAYCGEDGADILAKAYEGKRFKHHKDWVPLRVELLRSVGKTKDESQIKMLVDEARRSPEPALMAAAGEALGNFEDAPEKVRKEVVDDLIKRWGELDQLASQLGSGNIQAANARSILAATSDKWNNTLAKLTRQNFQKFVDWQKWNNKNRNEEWK